VPAIAARKWLKAYSAHQHLEVVAAAAAQLASHPTAETAYASGAVDQGDQLRHDVLEVPGAGPGHSRQGHTAIERELKKCTQTLKTLGVLAPTDGVNGEFEAPAVAKVVRRVLNDRLLDCLCALHDAFMRYTAHEIEARPVPGGGEVGTAAAKNLAKQKKRQTKKLLGTAIAKYNQFVAGLQTFEGFAGVVVCPSMSCLLDARDPLPLPSMVGGGAATLTHAGERRLHLLWLKLRCFRQQTECALETARSYGAAYMARGAACRQIANTLTPPAATGAAVRPPAAAAAAEPRAVFVGMVGTVEPGTALATAVANMMDATAVECDELMKTASEAIVMLSDLKVPPAAPPLQQQPASAWASSDVNACARSVGCIPLQVAISKQFAPEFLSAAAHSRAQSLANELKLELFWCSRFNNSGALMTAIVACLAGADANSEDLIGVGQGILQSLTAGDRAGGGEGVIGFEVASAKLLVAVASSAGMVGGSHDANTLLPVAAAHLGLQIRVYIETYDPTGSGFLFQASTHGTASDVVIAVACLNDSWLPLIDASWLSEAISGYGSDQSDGTE
jgi:hypothetical protein